MVCVTTVHRSLEKPTKKLGIGHRSAGKKAIPKRQIYYIVDLSINCVWVDSLIRIRHDYAYSVLMLTYCSRQPTLFHLYLLSSD